MAVFHRLVSEGAVLTGGGRLVAAVAHAARLAGLALPGVAAWGQGGFDEEDVHGLLELCVALHQRGAQVPGQEVLEAFLRSVSTCELVAASLAADAWLQLATDELRDFGFFARSVPTRPDALPDPVEPSDERIVELMLQDQTRVVPVTLYPQSMQAACSDFMHALAQGSRGLVHMEIGEATSHQDPDPSRQEAPFGEDHVEVPFRIDGAPHVARFSWETKYALRVDTALPTVNAALRGMRWRIVEGEGERGFALFTDEELLRLRSALGVAVEDPSDVPC